MIDTHCHLNDSKYDGEVDEIVNNYLQAGITKAICVAWDYSSSVLAKKYANIYESVYYEVGVHPDNCNSYVKEEIENLLINADKKLVAVGEIGLDYFHNKENRLKQQQVFISQIELAKTYNLPIVIHCRDAYGDVLDILKKYAPFNKGVVFHCYSGSWDYAKELLKLGIKISFTGSVTFKNAHNLHEVAKNLPDESFFFETDSPYLTPEPHRGERNEPKNVKDVLKFVANLRGQNEKELEKIVDKNAISFFKF